MRFHMLLGQRAIREVQRPVQQVGLLKHFDVEDNAYDYSNNSSQHNFPVSAARITAHAPTIRTGPGCYQL